MNSASEITRPELEIRLAQPARPLVIEVLPQEYFARGHLPGAVNVPLAELDRQVATLAPDRDAEIITYCSGPTCSNSHLAAQRLRELGYRQVRAFTGGKAAWRDAGLELELGEAAVPASEVNG